MKTGIAVFAYNRSWHLQQVLDNLQKNEEVDKLYIFQDGLKCEAHRKGWENVRKLIDSITWCETCLQFADYNKGLARSIIEGVGFVLEENDTVIVLEDDCVPATNFVTFMKQCFIQYRNDKNVYSVSGYNWGMKLEKTEYDVWGCGRFSSWGWGTWKDRWEKFCVDTSIVKRMKEDKNKSRKLALWGNDLEMMMLDSISCRNDSWAVYWALNIIENDGVCINSYEALIQNIGLDGTGVHCGAGQERGGILSDCIEKEFKVPKKIDITREIEKAFAELYGGYAAINVEEDESKERILVYGLGKFYFQNAQVISEKYNVETFIDRGRRGWYAGKRIIRVDELDEQIADKILIMVWDMEECIQIVRDLVINRNVSPVQILLGYNISTHFSDEIESFSIMPDGSLMVTVCGNSFKMTSGKEFEKIYDIFVKRTYEYFVNNGKKDVVIDIGMGIGQSTLYFLNSDKVEKVYGYETSKSAYLCAKYNLKEYLDKDKVEIFSYGISDRDEKGNEKEIEYKEASKILKPLIERYLNYNIGIKIEMREEKDYQIIDCLSQANLLNKVAFLIIVCQRKSRDRILNILAINGFSCFPGNITEKEEIVYAYRTINGGDMLI